MKVLIVDDEPLARRRLMRMLEGVADVEVVGQASDADEAVAQLIRAHADLMLLDIRMPGMDGLSLARSRSGSDFPAVIFTTAYSDYAVQAFDIDAVDYLLKPISKDRLSAALDRARRAVGSNGHSADDEVPPEARLTISEGGSTYCFDARRVPRLYAADKYTVLPLDGREHLLEVSLRELEQRLAPIGFVRTHRAELVNVAFVRALHGSAGDAFVELGDGQRARVSRRQLHQLRRALSDRSSV